MRIYRHALESIFAMLQLEDLSRVLAVCREWSAAVRSMRPIGARIQRDGYELGLERKTLHPLPPIDALIKSPLLRHVGVIEIKDAAGDFTPLTSESLALLTQHAPHLTSLWCSLTLTPGAPRLSRRCISDYPRLVLCTGTLADADLSLLAASPSLRDLSVPSSYLDTDERGDSQLDQIRSSLGHLQRIAFGSMNTAILARLLQPPITMRWQDIGMVSADAQTGDVLAALPTLTKLDLSFTEDVPHADYISRLPLLTTLKLDCRDFGAEGRLPTWHMSSAAVLSSLLPCTGLTELDLDGGLISASVSELLANLTHLRKLSLRGWLDSLQCFASGPQLQELALYGLDTLALPQLSHLFALKHLRSLRLWRSFPPDLDAVTLASLSPPSAALPRLIQFELFWMHSYNHWDIVKRRGLSWEWMQQ